MTAVSEPRQALAGVTVLDLATYLAAPVCATLLGEFGADVIKVEQPRVGDDLRRLVRPVAPSAGGSYWWFVEARNKQSITSNLRSPDRAPGSPGTPTVPDYRAGVFGAVGALVALRHAERTGEGQVVDLALYEPVLRVLDDAIAVFGGTGQCASGSARGRRARCRTTTIRRATGAGSRSPAPTTGCSRA